MAPTYVNEKLAAAIKNHLLRVDALPPTTEVLKLSSDLARICLTELNAAGLLTESIENLFAPSVLKSRAQGTY
jgi:hypothetical protein